MADFYRIQSALITFEKKHVENQKLIFENLNKIKILTGQSDLEVEQIFLEPIPTSFALSIHIPENLMEIATQSNREIQQKKKQTLLAQKALKWEKSNQFPNMNLLFNYDRGGNIMQDFFGIGIGFDIPIFNRNQPRTKIARYNIQQSELMEQQTNLKVQNEVEHLNRQLKQYENILQKTELSQVLNSDIVLNYSKNLLNKQISLLEFIDFTEAYLEAQSSFLELYANYLIIFEELKHTIGLKL